MSSYNKTFWSDNESPAIDADHLNNIENGIEGVTDEVEDARGNYQNLKQRLDNITTPTDEQVAEAVEEYLEEHPPAGNFEIVTHKKDSISNQSQTGDSDTNYPTVGAVRDFTNNKVSDLEDYVDDELDAMDADKADKATTLAGYGITDAYTKAEVNTAIQTAIGGIENGSY